jgi:hypothetical protein
MTLPSRPVTATTIDSEWGQAVHDYTFAPAGGAVSGADVSTEAGSLVPRKLPLDTAIDDPGGWLDASNDRLEVPANGAGLYLFRAWVRSDEGSSSDETRVYLRVNNVEVSRVTEGQEGATAISCVLVDFLTLVEGDVIAVWAAQVGTGSRATVGVVSLKWCRLGAEFGSAG